VKKYISLKNLEVYIISRELSLFVWNLYKDFDFERKICLGQQLIRSVDSVGANIAEGYGRYHFLDRVKFFYNARASLYETMHWIELANERNYVNDEDFIIYEEKYKLLLYKINSFIKSIKDKNN